MKGIVDTSYNKRIPAFVIEDEKGFQWFIACKLVTYERLLIALHNSFIGAEVDFYPQYKKIKVGETFFDCDLCVAEDKLL